MKGFLFLVGASQIDLSGCFCLFVPNFLEGSIDPMNDTLSFYDSMNAG